MPKQTVYLWCNISKTRMNVRMIRQESLDTGSIISSSFSKTFSTETKHLVNPCTRTKCVKDNSFHALMYVL